MGRKTRKQQKRTRCGRGRTIRRKSSVRAKKMVGGVSQFKSLLKEELRKVGIVDTKYSSYKNEDLVSNYGVHSIGVDSNADADDRFLTLDQKKGVAWWRAVIRCNNISISCSDNIPIISSSERVSSSGITSSFGAIDHILGSHSFIRRSDALYDSDSSIGLDDSMSGP